MTLVRSFKEEKHQVGKSMVVIDPVKYASPMDVSLSGFEYGKVLVFIWCSNDLEQWKTGTCECISQLVDRIHAF